MSLLNVPDSDSMTEAGQAEGARRWAESRGAGLAVRLRSATPVTPAPPSQATTSPKENVLLGEGSETPKPTARGAPATAVVVTVVTVMIVEVLLVRVAVVKVVVPDVV